MSTLLAAIVGLLMLAADPIEGGLQLVSWVQKGLLSAFLLLHL